MGTKTISLKDEAYERLRTARRYPGESFSEIVLRATWPEDTVTGRTLLGLLRGSHPRLSEDALSRAERGKREALLPEDKWAGR